MKCEITVDDTLKVKVNHPYIMLQDYGGSRHVYNPKQTLSFDFNGEFEWHIYRMTMKNPYLYWLQSAYVQAARVEMIIGTDPGYYTEASVGPYANALAKAQAALEAQDDALAKEAVLAIEAAIDIPENAERNPVVAGTYVIEADDARFLQNLGAKVAVCAYFNPNALYNGEPSASSEYTLWWTKIPFDYSDIKAIDPMFQFELVPAVITEDAPEGSIYSEELAVWYEDSVVTEEQLANAFFIKSVRTGQYAGVSELVDANTGIPCTSQNIGFTDEPEYPYIIREQGAYKFDIWCPVGPNNCFHQLNHSNGAGQPSHIVHWNGGSGVQASLWQFRRLDANTSISDIVTDDAEGDVISVSYYTVDGAAVAAPVKGAVNIIKKVYANGVVKTAKEFVK